MTPSKKTKRTPLSKPARFHAPSSRKEIRWLERDPVFRPLVESLKDCAIFMLDPDGNVADWNAGAERQLGYDADEIVGKHFSCFYSVDDIRLGRPESGLQWSAVEGRYEEQSWRIRKDGSRFFANMMITALMRAGELEGFSLITRDLTEFKFAEISRGLFESFPDAIVVLDHHGRITRTNAQFESMFGYSRAELQDKPVKVLIPERFSERFEKYLAEYFADRGVRRLGTGVELFGRRRDRSEFPIDITLSPTDTDGTGGVIAVARDVTEPRLAAERLRKANDELMASVSELQRRDREMQSLISMDDLLQSCSSQEEAYKVVALAALELFEGQTGCLAAIHSGNQYLEVVARWGDGPFGEPIFSLEDCWALRRGQLHDVSDPQAGLLCRHFARQPETGYVCVPLTVQGETLGVFCLMDASAKRSKHELSQLQLAVKVSEAIKLSLSNLKLREKLRAEAIHDPLTGLFNRRYLEETLPRELHRARRRNSPLCVAMLDLDNFKRFNDQHGHDAGDSLLRELGRVLRNKLRKSDISCRYGGEEFVLVFPDSTLADAEQRVQQLRFQLKELQISHGDQRLGAVTVSAGVAQAFDRNDPPSELLRAADEALYAAKNAGRNRVVVSQATKSDRRAE